MMGKIDEIKALEAEYRELAQRYETADPVMGRTYLLMHEVEAKRISLQNMREAVFDKLLVVADAAAGIQKALWGVVDYDPFHHCHVCSICREMRDYELRDEGAFPHAPDCAYAALENALLALESEGGNGES